MTIKENVQELIDLAISGKGMDAFEKFYADDVVMIENSEAPREGKDANREFEKQFGENIQEVHEAKANGSAVDEEKGFAFIYWHYDMTFKDGNRKVMDEVAVQKWQDGKIVKERFFYDSKE